MNMGFSEQHASKTERLALALVAAGWVRVDSRSERPCYRGKIGGLMEPAWIWTDRSGGARWARGDEPRFTKSIPVPEHSIDLLLASKQSKFFGPVA
jgi:hypothetical protein